MLVRALSAAMIALLVSGVALADEPDEQAGQPRAIEPTEEELAQFQLTPPTTYPDGYRSPAFRLSGAAMFAASAADLTTTELGLSQGLREGNPAAGQRGIRIASHVAGPLAVYYATEQLQRSGKTKLALGLRIALMAAYSYAAVHNTRLIATQ